MNVSIIVPVFNEEKYIFSQLEKVERVRHYLFEDSEIIIVNDGSSDGTEAQINRFIATIPADKKSEVFVLTNDVNQGKGACLKLGIKKASNDYIIIQDADLEYSPDDWADLIKPIQDNHADVVYGSRFIGEKPHRIHYFWHYAGNRIITFISNLFTDLNLSDVNCGYKVFPRNSIDVDKLSEKRFAIDVEITIMLSNDPALRFYEVGIGYYGREKDKGKKTTWRDGMRTLFSIFKHGDPNKIPFVNIITKISPKIYFLIFFIWATILRLNQYFTRGSFWLDECALALNLRDRDYTGLLQPLDYNQVAPIGFLLTTKFFVNHLGQNELVYRIVPVLTGVFSIVLLYLFVKKFATSRIALISSFIYIFPIVFTNYSTEIKQYMSDTFFTLAILYLYFQFFHKQENIPKAILLGVFGGLFIGFSNIIIIILTSIGIYGIISLIRSFSVNRLLSYTFLGAIWLLSFFQYYTHFIKNHSNEQGMQNYWANFFAPIPTSFADLLWVPDNLWFFFKQWLGYHDSTWIPFLLLIIAIYLCFRKKQYRYLFLLLPMVIHVILSMFKLYPFDDKRLILYLAPLLITLISIGIYQLSTHFKYALLATILFTWIVTARPRQEAEYWFNHKPRREHIRPVLKYISENIQDGDKIYIYYGSIRAFRFYKYWFGLDRYEGIEGIPEGIRPEKFVQQIEDMEGRTWILFSHMNDPNGVKYIEDMVADIGIKDQHIGEGSKTYLVSFP
ncbi:MAG: glycosyltransferase [Bacteroidetes bacterium]|nr:glycosyltransferase [Bacteroidota bacterium]